MIRLFECRWGNPHFVEAQILYDKVEAYPPWRPFYVQSLIGKCPRFKVRIDSPKSPPDCFATDIVFFFSERLKVECDEIGVEAEYFEIDLLVDSTVFSSGRHYLANFRKEIDAIDGDRSVCSYRDFKNHRTGGVFHDWVDKIEHLVIDEQKAAGVPLFLLARVFEPIVCVSERFQEMFNRNGFSGVDFIDPSNYNKFST